jgi:hypothetical protein
LSGVSYPVYIDGAGLKKDTLICPPGSWSISDVSILDRMIHSERRPG